MHKIADSPVRSGNLEDQCTFFPPQDEIDLLMFSRFCGSVLEDYVQWQNDDLNARHDKSGH